MQVCLTSLSLQRDAWGDLLTSLWKLHGSTIRLNGALMLFTPRPTVETWRWHSAFPLVLWIALALDGCSGNTCFVSVSNPPNGIIGIAVANPSTPCVVPKVFAAIHVTAHATGVCESCSRSNRVGSILLPITGIDLRAKINNAGETPDWQALLPALERPLQINLASGSGEGITRIALGESTTVPAGTYDLVRLRLAIDEPGVSDGLPAAQSRCTGHSCVFMEDGRVESLQFGEGAPELLIPLKVSTDVALGSDNELSLDLTPIWSVFCTTDQKVALFPSLTGSAKLERRPQITGGTT